MGGRDTEVTDGDDGPLRRGRDLRPARTRADAPRRSALSTDASYRFERGVDAALAPASAASASRAHRRARRRTRWRRRRWTSTPASRARDAARAAHRARRAPARRRAVPAARAAELLGASAVRRDVEERRERRCTSRAPTWRRDVVARGGPRRGGRAPASATTALPDELRPYRPAPSTDAPLCGHRRALRDALVAAGLLEARPMPVRARRRRTARARASIRSPRTRRTCAARCWTRSRAAPSTTWRTCRATCGCSRSARCSRPAATRCPTRASHVAVLVMGDREPPHFTERAAAGAYDAWDAKGLAELVGGRRRTRRAGGAGAGGRRATVLWRIVIDGRVRGEVSPRVALDAPVWASPAFGVELALRRCPTPTSRPRASTRMDPRCRRRRAARRGIARCRPRRRPSSTSRCSCRTACAPPTWSGCMREAAGELLERLVAFDVYEGAGRGRGPPLGGVAVDLAPPRAHSTRQGNRGPPGQDSVRSPDTS